jgi:hypothetical protein
MANGLGMVRAGTPTPPKKPLGSDQLDSDGGRFAAADA